MILGASTHRDLWDNLKRMKKTTAFGIWPWFLYMQIQFPVHGTQPSETPCHQHSAERRPHAGPSQRSALPEGTQGCLESFFPGWWGISRTHWGILRRAFLVLQLHLHLGKMQGPCAGLSLPAHVPPVPSPRVPNTVFGAVSSPLIHRNFGTFICLAFFFFFSSASSVSPLLAHIVFLKSAICLFQRCQF